MPRIPRAITAKPHLEAGRAKYTTHDTPHRVMNPGDKGYRNTVPKNDRQRAQWQSRATTENIRAGWAEDDVKSTARYHRRMGALVLTSGAVAPAASAAVTPLANHSLKRERARTDAKRVALGKVYDYAGRWDEYHPDEPLTRDARSGGIPSVTSLPKRHRPGRLERVGRFSVKHPNMANAVYPASALAGIGLIHAGTHRNSERLKTSQRQLRTAQAKTRRAAVTKGLYQRDSRTSPVRILEAGAGLGLLGWGLGRSGMLGSALAHGVKYSAGRGDIAGVQALQMAQAAQGVLRRGTAIPERNLRQVRAINSAVERVPSGMRPAVATATGLLLTTNAHPVRRDHYSPIGITGRVRGW